MSTLENRFTSQVDLEIYQSQVANLELFWNILGDNIAELKQVQDPQHVHSIVANSAAKSVKDIIQMLNGF
ncbi:hypothetical protein [Faucicola boevrei]|uniref:hypothetical protein n=1 Tax=Faucicola boevrei TaxID=346665 RepID=UPI000376747C|nr:hypothetical protein [Moraxella boevrei]